MIRLSSISTLCDDSVSLVDYEIPEEPNGEYIVDTSAFIPMSEAIKQLKSGALGAGAVNGLYDFADGRDTGMKVPFDRTHSFTGDLSEMSVAVRDMQSDVADGLQDARKQFEREQFNKRLYDSINNNNSDSDSSK